jgi:steroid delta-isomerase-like uncharacterized protein
MSEENKEIVRRFIEGALDKGNLAAIYQYTSMDFVDHTPMPGLPNDRDGLRKLFSSLKIAFPDLTTEIHDQIAEGDKVVTRATMHGTHKGDFFGIAPTGKTVDVGVTAILRLAGGKIVERWAIVDNLSLMQQVGAMPAQA